MSNRPNRFAFTLPFFVALVLMLSVYTYKFGTLINPSASFRFDRHWLRGKVLGVETVIPSKNNSYLTHTVVTNADGSKTEHYKEFIGERVIIKMANYNIFGEKVFEHSYNTNISELEELEKDKYVVPTSVEPHQKLPVREYPNALFGMVDTLFTAFMLFIR